MSRVIQTCLKYGTAEQREQIVKELLGHFVQLSTSPYARRITLKVMKYCPNHHRRIIQEFQGHMLRMLRHKVRPPARVLMQTTAAVLTWCIARRVRARAARSMPRRSSRSCSWSTRAATSAPP